MEKTIQYTFKIILIGDSDVGKTSLMTRYTDQTFVPSTLSTIGVDFKIKTIDVDGSRVKLQIWDTAGQERFRAMVSNYYRGAHGIFIVFDMLKKSSFEHLSEWIGELKKKDAWGKAEVIIVGNKVDNETAIDVTEDEIKAFLEKNEIQRSSFVLASAKDNIGVEDAFLEMTKRLMSRFGADTLKSSSASKPLLNSGITRKRCC